MKPVNFLETNIKFLIIDSLKKRRYFLHSNQIPKSIQISSENIFNKKKKSILFLTIKGRSGDICSREPCLHRGVCTQISQAPGYRCKCDGSGYWGGRCQRKCPDPEDGVYQGRYPHECIII